MYFAVFSSLVLSGCAFVQGQIESIDYPQDTAILIGDVPYQISPIKCFEIRGIDEDGDLDCYDHEGRKSASIAPVADYRRRIIEGNMKMKWASPEHQSFLFDFFHRGGKEKASQAIFSSAMRVYGNVAAIKDMVETHKVARELPGQEAKMRIQGTEAFMSGGMSAWQQHQSVRFQWHLNNSKYFASRKPFLIE